MGLMENNEEFLIFLEGLQNKIVVSQRQCMFSVNKELIMLYSQIGKFILENERNIEEDSIYNIAKELKVVFPHMNGFSEKNLKYMCKFAQDYRDENFIKNFASKISWGHHIVLINKIGEYNKRLEYINKILENGWSVKELTKHIDMEYEECDDVNTTNDEEAKFEASDKNIDFKDILTDNCNILSDGMFKDPYIFDFFSFSEELKEKDLKKQLSRYVVEYFLELQSGFAFLGEKYHLKVEEEDYYLDMLFYNLKLKCYMTVELKIGNFKPTYLGNLSFYLSLVDDTLKKEEENSTIGVILCMDDEKLIVQYAFKENEDCTENAEYRLTQNIPEKFALNLPTVKHIGTGIKEKFKD